MLRHEVFFLLIVYLFETPSIGLKAGKVTEVLKTGNKIRPSDRNKTWSAGRRLVEKGYLDNLRTGYYRMTPRGYLYVKDLIKDMLKHSTEFKVFHL